MSRDDGVSGFDSNGDGSVSQTTTPASVFNPSKSTAPTVSAHKEYDYTQTTTIDTSLSDSYFSEQLNSSLIDSGLDKGNPSVFSRIWSGLAKSLKTLNSKKGKIGQDANKALKSGWVGVQKAYKNAHPAAKATFDVALTITEFGLTKMMSPAVALAYDYYSGYNFDTAPTSISGLIGWGYGRYNE